MQRSILSYSVCVILCIGILPGSLSECMAQATPKRGNGYGPQKRLEWYWESRLGDDGRPVNATALNRQALKSAEKMSMISRDGERSFSGDWGFIGPATMQPNYYSGIGRVNRIAFHPTDPDVIYAATAGGGLWRTPNHGTVWYPLSDHIGVNNLTGIVIHPDDPDLLYILTGDGETGGENGQYALQKSSIGVLKSLDGGQTWGPTGLSWGQNERVAGYDLVVNPEDPDMMLVGSSKGVFVTDDGGDFWSLTYPRRIYTARFQPGNPEVVFAVGTDYIYRSSTFGFSWQDSVQIPQFEGRSGRMTLDISAADPDLVYVIAGPGSSDTSMFRGMFMYHASLDTLIMMSNEPNLMTLDETDEGDQSWYDLALVCDPTDPNRLMMGAVHMHRSEDGGSSWTEMEKSGANTWHDDIHYLIVSPLNGYLYAGTDGGIYYTEDWGENWAYISEYMRATQYYRIAVSQQSPHITIGGTQDNGTNMKIAQHTQFTKIYHKDGMDCAIHPTNDDLMIYSCQDGEFRISFDGGANSDSLVHVKSLPDSVESAWVTAVAWDPNYASTIWIGYRPIHVSYDSGQTFNPIDDTIGGRFIMHVGESNSDRIYAGDYYVTDTTRNFKLWASDDGGDYWYPCHEANTFPDSNLVITDLTTNPENSAQVWISVGGWKDGQKVYRSLDGGVTWSNMTQNLPNTPVNAIIFEPTGESGPANAVYIGTDIGVFYRNDDLGEWKYFSNGLPRVEVTDLEINYNYGKIKAATYGRGIWMANVFSECENFHYLNETNHFTGFSYEFQANEEIEAENIIIDGQGSEVFYRAGELILLKQDFHALSEKGAFFKASIGPCDAVIEDD